MGKTLNLAVSPLTAEQSKHLWISIRDGKNRFKKGKVSSLKDYQVAANASLMLAECMRRGIEPDVSVLAKGKAKKKSKAKPKAKKKKKKKKKKSKKKKSSSKKKSKPKAKKASMKDIAKSLQGVAEALANFEG